VLVTGHTGFKGAWLSLWLEQLGARVFGLGLDQPHPGAAFHALRPNLELDARADIRDMSAIDSVFADADADMVFHLAAQSLVLEGYRDPVGTYETNVLGTVNVLKASADRKVSAVIVVTTDKVYANAEEGAPFVESDPLGAHDPYSTSKACADLVSLGWKEEKTRVGIGRAGNVIGGGDMAPDRLLPDARRSALQGVPLVVRHPLSVRPWQFVLEPLAGYLAYAEALLEGSGVPRALNFGPGSSDSWSVSRVVDTAFRLYGTGDWQVGSIAEAHEAGTLRIDSTLAKETLAWSPRLDVDAAIAHTVDWWRSEDAGEDLRALALTQLEQYST